MSGSVDVLEWEIDHVFGETRACSQLCCPCSEVAGPLHVPKTVTTAKITEKRKNVQPYGPGHPAVSGTQLQADCTPMGLRPPTPISTEPFSDAPYPRNNGYFTQVGGRCAQLMSKAGHPMLATLLAWMVWIGTGILVVSSANACASSIWVSGSVCVGRSLHSCLL